MAISNSLHRAGRRLAADSARVVRAVRRQAGRLRRRRFRLRFWHVALGLVVLGVLVSALMTAPAPLTILEARTELLRYTPVNRETMAIFLPRASLVADDGKPSACLRDVEVQPAGAGRVQVDVSRLPSAPGEVSLVLKGAWSWATQEGKSGALGPLTFLRIGSADSGCKGPAKVRLPVNGYVQVGSDRALDPYKMLTARAQVYGRSLPSLAFLGRSHAGAIYRASEIELPADARIGTINNAGEAREGEARWSGFADVDLEAADSGFDVRLATSDSDIGIVMPGASGPSPDRLSIGLLAQLSGDPLMQRLAGLFAVLFALIGILAQRWPAAERRP